MKVVFADTAFYVAATNRRDVYHDEALHFLQTSRARFVTTEYVLVEVANFLIQGYGRAAFVSLLAGLEADKYTDVVPASAALFQRGVALFAARPDKLWSLTDCISFVVMSERGITDALASDRHFTQAGFRALLTPGA